MALILSIETATNVCSVALHDDDKLLGNQSLYIAQSHSGLLIPAIQSLIKYCGLAMKNLTAIAVSKGPGSYTGLRIGVSTAKGLCHALNIPLIAINTLEAMGSGVANYMPKTALLCPMLDARRMEVYCLLANTDLTILEETRPEIIASDSFQNHLLHHQVYFFGNGAAKCKETIQHPNAHFIDSIEPDARMIGQLAHTKYLNQDFEDVAYFDPFYLKDFRISKPKSG